MISKQENGFTLVELAIALMVIGLLIGGVLKGQELIENARVTATMRQIKAFDTAAMIFRNTYNALPGDIKKPNRIPNCTSAICNIAGTGNGKIGDWNTQLTEIYNFFPHMVKAGMLQGPEGGTSAEMGTHSSASEPTATTQHEKFFPQLPMGVFVTISYPIYHGSPGINAYMVRLTTRQAFQLDSKMDNGTPRNSGDVVLSTYSSCPYTTDSDGIDQYDLDQADSECEIFIGSELWGTLPAWDAPI